jgi:hypothetical protein
MAKHTVDTSLHGKPVSVSADQVRQHPSIMEMPYARGSAKAGDPVPSNPTVTPQTTVRNVSQDDGGCPSEMPVPNSAVYQEPPAKVTAS